MSLASDLREFIGSGANYKLLHVPELSGQDIVEAIEGVGDLKVIPNSDGNIGTVENKRDSSDFGKNVDVFPFHADGAYYTRIPRYVILYCVQTSGGGETFFTETNSVIRALRDTFDNNLIDSLNIVYMGGDKKKYRHPLIERIDDREVLHWYSSLYLEPDINKLSANNRRYFTQLSAQVSTFLDNELKKRVVYEHTWAAGDLFVFDNQQVLHGRKEIDDLDSQRLLYRIWFDRANVSCEKEPIR